MTQFWIRGFFGFQKRQHCLKMTSNGDLTLSDLKNPALRMPGILKVKLPLLISNKNLSLANFIIKFLTSNVHVHENVSRWTER